MPPEYHVEISPMLALAGISVDFQEGMYDKAGFKEEACFPDLLCVFMDGKMFARIGHDKRKIRNFWETPVQ